jgi:hypothetical protein
MRITVPERVGKCRWCGCTDLHGCDVGCSWANGRATLCSECVDLDRLMKSVKGRQTIAEVWQESSHLALGGR